jgi:hypothetical protein
MTEQKYKAPEINRDYPNTGTMFARQKVEGKQPTAYGFIYLDGDVLKYIIGRAEDGKDVVLDIAGWSKIAKSGNRYQTLKISIPRNTESSGGSSDDVPF